eukprot:TRINITY_DN13438_c0_g1_i1.p1 TRINITY_DN13438_c0_g1~~TRINITY_DN13438_c0_g1_i1.p1  ORF type:complete len:133 (-),score=5.83 TRINITY_DN13438_c0_g1_i1:124-522(-)
MNFLFFIFKIQHVYSAQVAAPCDQCIPFATLNIMHLCGHAKHDCRSTLAFCTGKEGFSSFVVWTVGSKKELHHLLSLSYTQNLEISVAMAAWAAASLSRLSSPKSAAQVSNLLQRRGLAGGGDHHGPLKVNC